MTIEPGFWLAGGALVLVGIGLLVGSAWSFVRTRRDIEQMIPTTGIITKLDTRAVGRRRHRNRVAFPTVQFQAASGQPVEFESTVGSRPAIGKVGDAIGVLYHPTDPQRARISTFGQIWLPTLVFGLMGTIFLLIGGCLLGGAVLTARF